MRPLAAKLEAMGYTFSRRAGWMGSCHAIMIDPTTGDRLGGVDPRVEGAGASGG